MSFPGKEDQHADIFTKAVARERFEKRRVFSCWDVRVSR